MGSCREVRKRKEEIKKERRKEREDYWFPSCLSFHPHGKTWLLLDGILLNLILECLSKICRENSSFIVV
jgi:hypothetical protein